MFYHLILFDFHDKISSETICKMFEELGNLKQTIPEIQSYQFGSNDSSNINNKNFKYCFIMTFKNKADRYTYQNHPAHQNFILNHIKPIMSDFIVFDFEA